MWFANMINQKYLLSRGLYSPNYLLQAGYRNKKDNSAVWFALKRLCQERKRLHNYRPTKVKNQIIKLRRKIKIQDVWANQKVFL